MQFRPFNSGTKRDRTSSWHLYCIETNERERLQQNLQKNMIETGIHYPKPPHLQGHIKSIFKKLKLPITERKSKIAKPPNLPNSN